MQNVKQIEYHVTDACNLSCDFCAHYSNFHPPANMRSVDEAVNEWRLFSDKIRPEQFLLIGGEPTLHPQLSELVLAAKETWRDSRIRLATNGFFLDRHPELGKALAGGILVISLHWKYQKEEARIRQQAYELEKQGVEIKLWDFDHEAKWMKHYQLIDGVPHPFQSDPEKAYSVCLAQKCLVLRNAAIYKCPQVAYSDTVGIEWPEFRAYKPLLPDGDVEEFLSREAESCCSHCPETHQLVQITDPRKRIRRKNFAGSLPVRS